MKKRPELEISLETKEAIFAPGETVAGEVSWLFHDMIKPLEIRLIWYTKGKGTQDVTLVEKMKIDSNTMSGQSPFSFKLPPTPYSFSGKLISVIWALELVTLGKEYKKQVQIIMGPNKEEVDLFVKS